MKVVRSGDMSKKELKVLLIDVEYERKVESRMIPHVLTGEQLEEWRAYLPA